MKDLQDFLSNDLLPLAQQYQDLQLGSALQTDISDISDAEIVIVGCDVTGEEAFQGSANAIREKLYAMYYWHSQVKIADLGNIKQGSTVRDTIAALRVVLEALKEAGKTVVLLGAGHELTLEQYKPFKKNKEIIDVSVTDMLIDLVESESVSEESFLMELLTGQPNYIRHYNHIGFQSYYVQPKMLESLDKLRFDFYRLGKVRANMEDMEPVLRNTHLYSFDINAVKYSDAPANKGGSPNGFTGDEACLLTRYAGMSSVLSSLGIYGYKPAQDLHGLTATLIAQMIWYFIDGYLVRKQEAPLTEESAFLKFYLQIEEQETIFLKSKKTNRWWMQLPDQQYIPCSYLDYKFATENQIPERWLREQERLV